MQSKTILGIMLALLLVGMLTFKLNVQTVKASTTIYIRADGSIDPPGVPIFTADNITYTFTDNISDFLVIQRSHITVEGQKFTLQGQGTGVGVSFSYGTGNVTIQSINIKNFYYGISLNEVHNNTVTGNNITDNNRGISITGASPQRHRISGNRIADNDICGIVLGQSGDARNIVTGNYITNSTWGIWLWVSYENTISENEVTHNSRGMYFYGSSHNTVSGNIIGENSYGLYLRRHVVHPTLKSSDNGIFHNNLINNSVQVYMEDPLMPNFWDDGYPSGGNYWSNYTGVDEFSGPNQDQPGSDGIGDTPYTIDAYNRDRYPLMYPWTSTPLRVQGIDVSHHQGEIGWSNVYDAGYMFAFVKASEGIGWEDPRFDTNMQNAGDAELLVGAYHFGRPVPNRDNAKEEAEWFIQVAKDYLKAGYLRPALDIEDVEAYGEYPGEELGKEALSNWIHEWMGTVRNETGIEPILYVNNNYAKEYLDVSVAKYDLWIANWTYDPSAPPNTGIWDSWDFWQYSDEGSVPGISGNVDLDVFNGDMRRLYGLFVIRAISVYTDKHNYSTGDTMYLGLGVTNPIERAVAVCIAIWLELSDSSIYLLLHAHYVTLPAVFIYSNPAYETFVLPSLLAGTYTWHAAFLEMTTHTIIIEDTAVWQFS